MAAVIVRSFDEPDEEWELPGGARMRRGTAPPGWRWSEHAKPAAGTEWCELEHVGIVLSGREAIRMADGTEVELGPWDLYVVPPGHDAWIPGDEPCVALDLLGSD